MPEAQTDRMSLKCQLAAVLPRLDTGLPGRANTNFCGLRGSSFGSVQNVVGFLEFKPIIPRLEIHSPEMNCTV